ncbi:MAG: hypothetical protein HYX97_01925 [Chloroflexi bacterium]|nr:hypothetical protein [Chloroflexota bacterium]
MNTLGVRWFLDTSSDVGSIPAGASKVLFAHLGPYPAGYIQTTAQQAPGSVWNVIAEPNRRPGLTDPAPLVAQFKAMYDQIRAADPTARIASPAVLNWDFTCYGCGGYKAGATWITEFRTAYRNSYGTEPPWDVWAIDVYPIDWLHLPTVNAQLVIDQLTNMRTYMDAIPEHQGKMIWIMELSMHWGYTDMTFNAPGCAGQAAPAGTYATQQVIEYMRTVFNWLEANAGPKKIERWFQFVAYQDLTTCNEGAYAGISLFNGPDVGAAPSATGQFFRMRALQQGQ